MEIISAKSFVRNGHAYVAHKCTNCGKDHFAVRYPLAKKGFAFCSKKCSQAYRTKGKRFNRKCEVCGKEFTAIKSLIENGGGRYCGYECSRSTHAAKLTGKRRVSNEESKVGIKQSIRQLVQYKLWRQNIFIRDNFTCTKCGQKGGYLHAHHIKSFKSLMEEVKANLPLLEIVYAASVYTPMWDLNNGVTMCRKCHRAIHGLTKKENI